LPFSDTFLTMLETPDTYRVYHKHLS
jgi:hypothetical protein